MEYIFEHEQLRIDEIARKINVKNSFTPLKPLRSMNLGLRRNTIQSDGKRKIFSDSSNSNKRYNIRSISPVFAKLVDSEWKHRTFVEFCNWKDPKLEKVCLERENREMVLPEIGRKRKGNSGKDYGRKGCSKGSQNFIAYIPTVSFLKN